MKISEATDAEIEALDKALEEAKARVDLMGGKSYEGAIFNPDGTISSMEEDD